MAIKRTRDNKILMLLIAALSALAFTMFWTMITKTWDELRTLRENYNILSCDAVRFDCEIKNLYNRTMNQEDNDK